MTLLGKQPVDYSSSLKDSVWYGFWNFDPDEGEFFFSAEAAIILEIEPGVSRDCTIPNLLDSFKPDFKKFYEKAFVQRLPAEGYFAIQNSRGTSRWVHCKSRWDERDQIVSGIVEDTTQARWLNESSRIKTNLSNKIETIAKTGSFEWNLNEDYLICSDNFFSITQIQGYNQNNRVDKSVFYSVIAPQQRNFVLEVMHECITLSQDFEVTFFTSSSSRKKIKLYGHPEGNTVTKKLIGVVVDITDQVQKEKSIIHGQDLERKRISLELHDSVGQKLVAVKYMMSLARITNDFSGIADMAESMDNIIEEIRSITHNLSTQIVKEVGLSRALSQLLSESAKALSAEQEFKYQLPEDLSLSADMSKTIYRIIQECLSNALKHSKASKLELLLTYRNKQISLIIGDNGIGFNSNEPSTEGIGVQNIRQRVNYLNGFFRIASEKGQGTKYIIKIPIES